MAIITRNDIFLLFPYNLLPLCLFCYCCGERQCSFSQDSENPGGGAPLTAPPLNTPLSLQAEIQGLPPASFVWQKAQPRVKYKNKMFFFSSHDLLLLWTSVLMFLDFDESCIINTLKCALKKHQKAIF